ncbi:MAG: type II secretion system protein M [Thioalkalispiraceae bacterium]|jgi:general secretion pathway protein M
MMKQYLANLTTRERQMLVSALVVIVLFIVYQSWASFSAHVADLQHRVDNQQETLDWMQQAAREVKILQGANVVGERPKGKQLLLGLIDRTAKQNQLNNNLQKVQPEGEQGVRVWLENASFDNVVVWLDTLQFKHGLVVTDISIDKQGAVGNVNIRALIETP